MSAIILINTLTIDAEFRIALDHQEIARISVTGDGQAEVPTTTEYTAQAFTSMGDFSLDSNQVSFTATTFNLLVRVIVENGYYDFQLVGSEGTQPNAIVCENTWDRPVKFRLARPNSPFEVVTVVDEHNNVSISTAQAWTIYAIVNGITTPGVTTANPDAAVTLVPDNQNGYSLKVER